MSETEGKLLFRSLGEILQARDITLISPFPGLMESGYADDFKGRSPGMDGYNLNYEQSNYSSLHG